MWGGGTGLIDFKNELELGRGDQKKLSRRKSGFSGSTFVAKT